ncbi:alpha-glucan phosphorylase [Kingella kingae]|uniref:alpha-glucan phosphorylase n=1 Tax=Kingella kingae TaxID=504 RepID=UPI00254E95DB|nr:alpha-glucan phosphorylase [Kingella kingae]MDK4545282.1 alpha-glucan phosphorylase [Kingella kingae]MDK4567305.1 alpha-glucan phosphorylase [Kingella kingae]MDK4590112.1 alpha-glucan phosphorylase [Kingella kingae]MDK4629089.1 alpha-glucan phosphorylase [Kingella kingae]MDK4636994.1 alpha-glucan phosphorylase [Kingella kingae]
MNHDLPQVKTVKLLFVAMDEQQQAMFKMAFKMHNTTNYQVIEAGSGEKPELVIVDGDGTAGISAWQKAKGDYPGGVVVYFSKSPPSVTAPYLSKPIKFDTLFLSLRNLMQGNGVWVVHSASAMQQRVAGANPAATRPGQPAPTPQAIAPQNNRVTEIVIPRFDPNVGLLGAFRDVLAQQRNAAITLDEKPILAVFPAIQRVWVAVDSDQLKNLCRQGNLELKIKQIPDDSNIQERANATVTSSMWQIALWTANGRLVQPLNPNTVFKLKSWPNLTRLAPLPESMRLSAFLTKTSVSLNMLYKLMPLDMADILNYIAATYLTDYLGITQQVHEVPAASSATQATVNTSAAPRPEQVQAASSQQPQKTSGGLLSRLMKKLLNK